MARDTIYALSTGPGSAGIAVVRLSGPGADAALRALGAEPLPSPRRAQLRCLRDEDGDLIDQALVLRFVPGASYTGEAMAELHCHGGRAVVAAVLARLGQLPDCRLAEPGEFTRRALEEDKIDLVAAEALSDLIAAETECQRRQAVMGMTGALGRLAESWRGDLLRAVALVEVTIDWADEEVPEDVGPEVGVLLERVRTSMLRQIALSSGAERLRNGFEVAILGAPNSGKSSLFNALAGREAAITSTRAGTTRDVLELRYDLAGFPVVFLDTAGLRASTDEIEALGVERALSRAQGAALRIFLFSPDTEPLPNPSDHWRDGDLRVWNKRDLADAPDGYIAISAARGGGVVDLLAQIEAAVSQQVSSEALVGHLRQRQAVEDAVDNLRRAEEGISGRPPEEIAEDMRAAIAAVELLVGRIRTEDVLGEVFARFCVGK
ncbi:MAG: tRNA uridine-5-carboxymethylaminomethyl(34) synthesis GTPase MnmE [Paracoccaceae bacterium]|nr:tRNA uridine-5-carboxymethylaminomethyl(34) synthesis GTPase MnmE [Paracoccaceae bacterium]